MSAFRRDRFASELETALEGGPIRSERVDALASIAHGLRDMGLAQPIPAISATRRDELLAAVADRKKVRSNAGALGRFRGASLGVAVVAGGGLVVASAASGSSPASFVADVAREVQGLRQPHSPPLSVSIEGEVVASHDNGRTFEVRTGNETIVVESPRQARDVTAEGTPIAAANIPEGSTIRVTSNRDSDAGVVPATKIEVLPTASVAQPRPDNSTATIPGAKPTNDTAAANTTPRPSATPTKTPSPTHTPKASSTSVAVVPVEPTKTPTPTPTVPPKRTPTPAPVTNDTADVIGDADVVAPGSNATAD